MTTWPAPTTAPSTTAPTTDPTTASIPSTDRRRFGGGGLFALAAGIGAAVATVIGGAVGFYAVGAASAECSSTDDWCGLGALLAGVAIGLFVAAVAYIAAGVAVIRRYRPAGQRANHIVAHVIGLGGLIMLPGFVGGIFV